MKDIYTFENNFRRYDSVSSTLVLCGKVQSPEITIFIPTFKRASTLEVTVKSALEQVDALDYEIIIVNNDPEEGMAETKSLLEKINSEKIYYFVNQSNIGLCGNWNRGIELARGKYVAMIHDDDMLSPYFLRSIAQAIEANEEPAIIGVDYYTFDSNNMPVFREPVEIRYRSVTKKSFFFGRYINVAGMTVKKDFLLKIGGYREEYYPNEDTIMIYQALLGNSVINVEHPLAGYRQEMNLSLSENTMEKIIFLTEITRRNISKYEGFAKKWTYFFDKEYLYKYIIGANSHWGLEIDYKKIFKMFNMSLNKPNAFKMKMMSLFLKLERYRGESR